MALDVSADNLRREINDAIRLRNEITDLSAETVKRLAGPDYRTTWQPTEDQHQNYSHEMVTNTVPALFYSNPTVSFGCSTLPPDHPFIRAENIGLNQWIKQARLKRVLTRVAVDVCVDFGVVLVTMDRMPGYETAPAGYEAPATPAPGPGQEPPAPPPLWPCIHRVSPVRFFTDPQASDDDLYRFRGHIWIRDKDDLLAAKNDDGSPKFDPAMVEVIAEDANIDKAHRKIVGQIGRQFVTRRQVVGYEIYVPETGMIYTLGVSLGGGSEDGRHGFLRDPRPYYGPRRGPYVMFGVHVIPDQVYPVSPLAISLGLIRELNAHAGQAAADAAAAKRLIIVDSTNQQLLEAVQSALSGSVIGVPNFDGKATNLDIGGAMPETLNHIARLREVLDRQTGLTETKRGNLTGVTAREIAEASSGSDTRTRFMQDNFRGDCGSGVVGVLELVAEHLWESNQVRFNVAFDDPNTGERRYEEFRGGDPGIPGLPHTPFRRLQPSISIDPFSMEMVDQSVLQRRIQTATTTTLAVLGASRQFPELKVREVLNDAYESLNIKDGASRYVDMGILAIERAKARAAFGLQPGGANQVPAGPQGQPAAAPALSPPEPGSAEPGETRAEGVVPAIPGVSRLAAAV